MAGVSATEGCRLDRSDAAQGGRVGFRNGEADSQSTPATAISSGMKSPRKKPNAAKLKRWRVSIMRARGQHIGTVEAESREAAEASAIKTFNLTEEQRRRLAILEGE
jgi:hypothetical protein